MKIDEMIHNAFQNDVDKQPLREPKPEEIEHALNTFKTRSEKRSWGFMALAAVYLGCFVFAFSMPISFSNMPMSPLARTITAVLPENPGEEFILFVQSVQLGMNSKK